MANPYLNKGLTRLKIVLPCSREKAWNMIATPVGISSWFPYKCTGEIKEGKNIQFNWGDGNKNTFKVLKVKEGKEFVMSWFLKGTVAYALDNKKPITLTLKVTYPKTKQGREAQLLELPGWTFFLTNLKSKVMSGKDLRDKSKKSWRQGYID